MIIIGPDDASGGVRQVGGIKADLRKLETRAARRRGDQRRGARRWPGDRPGHPSPHRRRRPGAVVGLPEVHLGLLPGGGGVARTVRMFGIQKAFYGGAPIQGTRFSPAKAKDDRPGRRIVVASTNDPGRQGVDQGQPRAGTPSRGMKGLQDARRHRRQPGLAIPPSFPALLKKQLKGRRCPAPRAILNAAVEGRRSTSTPPAASRAGTSPSWPPARPPRT